MGTTFEDLEKKLRQKTHRYWRCDFLTCSCWLGANGRFGKRYC